MTNGKAAIAVALCMAGAALAGEGPEPQTADTIPGMYAVINKAWADRNLSGMLGVLGKDLAVVMERPTGARVFNRETFAAMLAKADLDKMGIASHKVRLVGTVQQGGLAFCGTATEHRMRDGRSNTYSGLNVLYRTDQGWRMAMACPAFVRAVLRVGKVLPDGAGKAAGLRAGDVFLRYDGKVIGGMPDLLAARDSAKEKASVPVVVRRNGREVTLQMKTGPLGAVCRHVLSAGQGATMEGAEVDAVRKAAEAHIDAVRRRDLKAFASRLSPQAYVDCTIQGQTARVLGRDALLAETRNAFQSKDAPLDKIRTAGIRVIQKGSIALLQMSLAVAEAPDGPKSVSFLLLMVKEDGKWVAVAGLAPLVDIAAKPQADTKP